MILFWYLLALVAIGIGILLKVWLSKSVKDWLRNRSRLNETASKLPGLRGLPVIGNALLFACKTEEILPRFLETSRPYERLSRFWLGPKLVIVVKKPCDIKSILQSGNATHKDPMLRFAEILFGRGLLTSSGSTHKIHRKVIVGMLNAKTVNSFVKYFDEHSRRCVELLKLRIGIGEFDVYPYMENCAVDSALDTILGTPGITQQDGLKELMLCVRRLYEVAASRMIKVWLQSDWVYAFTNYKKLEDRSLSVVRQFLENVISLKKKEYSTSTTSSEPSDTPRLILSEQLVAYNERMHLMDDDRLRDEILTLFITMEDSTTAVCAFVLLMLGIHPAIQERVRAELFEVLGEDSVTEKKLSELEYLGMVIKETLRLFPIGPILMRKLTGDVRLGDYKINSFPESFTLPEGCSVALIPYLTHRDPEHWSDPDQFNPDRFKPENSIGRHSHAYIPFSGGPRGCIGKQYAELYVKTVVAHVIRKYRIHSNTSLNEIKLKSDVTLRPVNGFKISISRV